MKLLVQHRSVERQCRRKEQVGVNERPQTEAGIGWDKNSAPRNEQLANFLERCNCLLFKKSLVECQNCKGI